MLVATSRAFIIATVLAAGVLFSQDARAAGQGESCGGFLGLVCDRGLWCDPFPGSCGWPMAGVCVKTSPICRKIYQPVCGCNGKTYPNDCVRRAHRVAKAHNGKC